MGQCCLFSFLAFLTNYLYILSLNWLSCTDVLALFACNVSFVYLLSWVVLHQQFVGIRVRLSKESVLIYIILNSV